MIRLRFYGITSARLDRVQRALGGLSEGLQRVRHLMEVDDYARFESAAEHLDDVGAQFEHGQRFTEGKKIRRTESRAGPNRVDWKEIVAGRASEDSPCEEL